MINWNRLFNVLLSCFISGFLGIGTARTIGIFNHNMDYGYYASYFITALLVLILNIHYIDFSKKE